MKIIGEIDIVVFLKYIFLNKGNDIIGEFV